MEEGGEWSNPSAETVMFNITAICDGFGCGMDHRQIAYYVLPDAL